MKRMAMAALTLVLAISVFSHAYAFNPNMLREVKRADASEETLVSASSLGDYMPAVRKILGKGNWLMPIPFSFTVPSGRMCTLKMYAAYFQLFPSETPPHWELLQPGTVTPSYGGIYLIISDREDEDIMLVGEIPTIKIVGYYTYLDMRDSKNAQLFFRGKRSLSSVGAPTGSEYYYWLFMVNPGMTLTGKALLDGYDNSNVVGAVISNKAGFLTRYLSRDQFALYRITDSDNIMLVKARRP